MWEGGDKVKSQKDLAKGAKLGIKDDIRILDYYRFYFVSAFINIDIHTNIITLVRVMISGIHEEVLGHYQIAPSFHLLVTPPECVICDNRFWHKLVFCRCWNRELGVSIIREGSWLVRL